MRNLHKIAGNYPDGVKWAAIWFKLVSRGAFEIRWSPTKKEIEYRTGFGSSWYGAGDLQAYKKEVKNKRPGSKLTEFKPEWLEWKE